MDLDQASWLRADPLLRIVSDAQTRLLTPSKPYLTVEIRCPLATTTDLGRANLVRRAALLNAQFDHFAAYTESFVLGFCCRCCASAGGAV